MEQHRDPLVGLEPTHVADPHRTRLVAGPVADGREPLDVDAETQVADDPPEPLPPQDAAGLVVAGVHRLGPSQGQALEPAKRRRIPFLDVLRAVEAHSRPPSPSETGQHEHLCGGQAGRLLVDVEHVDPAGAKDPPDGPRVVDEPVGVVTPGPGPDEAIPGIGLDLEVDHLSSLVPRQGGHEGEVDPVTAQLRLASSPRGHHP